MNSGPRNPVERQYILNYLKDMFSSTFDEDIIESVLNERRWEVDRAVDDLMTMTVGNSFEIPVEDVDIRDLDLDVLQVQNSENAKTDRCSTVCDDTKIDNEDDGIVILDEEEYVVPTESDDSESATNESIQPQPQFKPPSNCPPSVSYASMAQKPASEQAIRAAQEHAARAKPPFIIYQGYTSYDRIKRTRDSVERVKLFVQNRFKIMVILRGCPGSGKSTLANTILKECNVNNNPFWHIHSTDNYFCLNKGGQYKMDLDKLTEAHNWNEANVLSVMRQGLTPVIIDNTNTQIWHMERYVSMAVCAGYEMEVIEPDTPWAFNINRLMLKNSHGVPKDRLYKMLDHYDHNVSATTLLKNFRLTYSPELLPPQKGVRTLNDPTLVAVFDRLYHTIRVFPEKAAKSAEAKVTLSKTQRRKERRRIRKIIEEEAAAAAAFVELEELTETDSVNSVNDGESVDGEEEADEESESSDSDPSWLTLDEEGSVEDLCTSDEEDVEAIRTASSVNSDAVNESFEKNTIDLTVDDDSELPIDLTVEDDSDVPLPPSEGNDAAEDESIQNLIPVLVNELKNPLDTNEKDLIIADAAIEASGSRLKCFERLRDDGKKEGGVDRNIEQVMNNVVGNEGGNESVGHVFNNFQTTSSTSFELAVQKSVGATSSSSDSIVSELLAKSIENLGPELSGSSKKVDDNSNLINALENFALAVTKTPPPMESASAGEKIPSYFSQQECENSPKKNHHTPEKTTDNIYNADTKDRKLKLCNVEGQKNTSADSVSEAACSFKFKDDAAKNVIANDLWGAMNVGDKGSSIPNEEKELSDDNSDNSDSRSNSSSSDEIAITDVHNTSNRFVNNDITNEQSERKKPDINREKKNQNVADDAVDLVWNPADSMTPELGTLKERILVNSLDKVFNQNPSIEPPSESASAPIADKQTNLPQRRSTTSTPFHIIENRLKNERGDVCSPSSSRSDDFEDAIDSWENRMLNQWMRSGEPWVDENSEDTQASDLKKVESEIKPPRKIRDSPSKQKNTETVGSIRLVNDIRNVSDTSRKVNNQDSSPSQPLKSTNFQSQFWLDRAMPSPSLNTMQRMPSKEEDIESDFEAKSKSFLFSDDHSFEAQRNNHPFSRPFRNFDANESQFWPGLSDGASSLWSYTPVEPTPSQQGASQMNNASPELLDSLVARHRNIAKDENSSDFEKSVSKWSPFSDYAAKTRTNEAAATAAAAAAPAAETKSILNFFVPVDIMSQEMNKATNTGWDDSVDGGTVRVGRCREINEGRSSPEHSTIEASYKCDKSTMADVSNYTVKAKPLKEDLVNIFPQEMVDVVLDLYDKCKGNMDWILELLMDGGYSPSDDQLEYLSSLQNVTEYPTSGVCAGKDKVEKDKKPSDKRRHRNRNSRNGRGNNSQNGDAKRKTETNSSPVDLNDYTCEDSVPEQHVDLFLDWFTVSQLIEYFGNPTIYSIRDYQPTVKLPLSLARQLHAYLIGSIIDQAEENEDLINQLTEEDYSINSYIQNSNVEELTQKDVSEVENSLGDILKDPFDLTGKCEGEEAAAAQPIVRSKDSFASKLSLNLLLKAFPTLDSSFVKQTFKSQNFNYYETKNILNQFGKEVPVDPPRDSPPSENDLTENDDDVQFFGNHSNPADTRSEVLEQVTEFRRNASLNQHQWQKCHESLRTAVQEKKLGVAAYYRDIMNVFKQKYEENNAHAAAVLINSSCLQNSDMIDLHYFKVTEALKALDKFLDKHLSRLSCSGRSKMTVYIITGRGTRSVNGISRIQPPVKNRLKRRNISFEVESYNTGLVKAIIRKTSLMSTDL